MELIVPFDGQSESPLHEQIYQHIRNEIRQGKLEPGNHLPSTRIPARNLRLNRSTIQIAYGQLLSEGYIEVLPCRGYLVCKIEELAEVRRKGGSSFAEPEDIGEDRYEVDLSPRGVDLDSFPFNTWGKISRNTLVDDNKEMFATGDPRGKGAFRTAIGDYLRSARGMDCRSEQIFIGAGSEYLLMLLSQILGNGKRIATENPTYKQVYRVFKGEGYPVIPVDMDRYGMDMRWLSCSSADVVYVMPSHQYPTGTVIPVKRRQESLAWAYNNTDRYLIEDDCDSEFRYKGKSTPTPRGTDWGGRVVYMGTFPKSVAPTIRAGFMVPPEHLPEAYREGVGFYLSTVSRIDQNILYQPIIQEYYERHLNRMRVLYKGEYGALMVGLRKPKDWSLIKGEYAELHVPLAHRQGETEGGLVARTTELGVKVYEISGCFIQPEGKLSDSTVMLGYASLSEEEIRNDTKLLSKTWTF